MALSRALRSRYFHALLKPSNPPHLENSLHSSSILLSAHFYNTESATSVSCEEESKQAKKPLHVLFKEVVGLSENLQHSNGENQNEESNELKKKLRKLEEEVKKLKGKKIEVVNTDNVKKREPKAKPTSLYKLFVDTGNTNGRILDTEEDPTVYRELSPDMALFATHLYKEGYLRDANFFPVDKFDISCFVNSYARNYIHHAAEKFGKDKQEIAKWLSGSDLKKVALFGCPSLGKKNILFAKKLRAFFKIHEPTVCSKCTLKTSCKYVNQGVWKFDTKTLDFASAMRVITLYALESVHPELVVPNEIKDAVSRLLKEILKLSQDLA